MVAALRISSYGVTTPIRHQNEKLPEYHCSSCGRCEDSHCDFFNRHVDTGYNRCWNHTNYKPQPDLHYVSPPASYFKEIQKEEARKLREMQKQGKNIGFI